MLKNKAGKSHHILIMIYIGVPIYALLISFTSYMSMIFFETIIARYVIVILVAWLVLVYVISLTRRLNKSYSGFSRRLASFYLWFISFILIVLLAITPIFSEFALGFGHALNAPCINASEELNSDGSYNLPKMTKSIEGVLGSKNANHPARGDFVSPILNFKYRECIYGTFYNSVGEPEEITTHTDNIQLSLDKKEMEFHKKNKGTKVVVTGYFSRSNNANHTTHPFFFIVDDIRKVE
jgi:hypothetical protein